VFFRTLPPQKYAAGRDVYGNRDLAAYEDGRRDVEKIVKRFLTASKATPQVATGGESTSTDTTEDVEAKKATRINAGLDTSTIPKDIIKAYLERLARELQERADKL